MSFPPRSAAALMLAAASSALVIACSDAPGDGDARATSDRAASGPSGETAANMDNRASGDTADVAPPAEIDAHSGEGQIDQSVVVGYEIRDRDDVPILVDNAFARADEDDNGRLDYEEYLVIAPALGQADSNVGAAEGRDQTSSTGPVDYDQPTSSPDRETAERDEVFEAMAGDDGLTPQEFETALLERFDLADADGNDELGPDELRDFVRSMLTVPE